MRAVILRLIHEIRKDGLFDTAAGVTFWLILSLPAALLAVLSSVSLLGPSTKADLREATLDFVDRVLSSEADTVRNSIDAVFDQSSPGVLSVSIAIAIFTLSRGFAGLIRALDNVYDVDDGRNFAHTRLVAIGLAFGTLIVIAASSGLWSFGGSIGIPAPIRLLGAVAILVVWSATIFHLGPTHHTPWRYDLPGAGLAAFGWVALSLGFGWYVRLLGGESGNDLLGAAGALLLGLTWMWAACVVLLIGGEVNQIIAERAGVIEANRTLIGRVRAHREQR